MASRLGARADQCAVVAQVIAPHPKLTPAQARAISINYGIRGGSIETQVVVSVNMRFVVDFFLQIIYTSPQPCS